MSAMTLVDAVERATADHPDLELAGLARSTAQLAVNDPAMGRHLAEMLAQLARPGYPRPLDQVIAWYGRWPWERQQ